MANMSYLESVIFSPGDTTQHCIIIKKPIRMRLICSLELQKSTHTYKYSVPNCVLRFFHTTDQIVPHINGRGNIASEKLVIFYIMDVSERIFGRGKQKHTESSLSSSLLKYEN